MKPLTYPHLAVLQRIDPAPHAFGHRVVSRHSVSFYGWQNARIVIEPLERAWLSLVERDDGGRVRLTDVSYALDDDASADALHSRPRPENRARILAASDRIELAA